MTKYYMDAAGNYLGGYEGVVPPVGAIEVAFPPSDARMTWNGVAWIIPPSEKDVFVDFQRIAAYNKEGAKIEDLVLALWERVVENKPEWSDEIQVTRVKIQQEFPK